MRYQIFTVMDVFKLTKKEVIELELEEFNHMVNYAYTKFTTHRADLPWRKQDEGVEGIDYIKSDPKDFKKYYSRVHT